MITVQHGLIICTMACIPELTNFKDMYKVASKPLTYNRSYMRVFLLSVSHGLYSILTDTYEDIPYFQSNEARDSAIYELTFDAHKDIYMDIFDKLDSGKRMVNS